MGVIDSFKDKYAFLSNMFPVKVEYEGKVWNSSENIYQSFKTGYVQERAIFPTMSPRDSKRYWKGAPIRNPQFYTSRIRYMKYALEAKFTIPEMAEKLLATGDSELIEGNWWGDRFWGVCNGVGHNHLGKLLMKLRQELRDGTLKVKTNTES